VFVVAHFPNCEFRILQPCFLVTLPDPWVLGMCFFFLGFGFVCVCMLILNSGLESLCALSAEETFLLTEFDRS
jgi:hypothetical protein